MTEVTEVPAKYLMTPLNFQRGDFNRITTLIDFLVQHPGWLSAPVEHPDALRAIYTEALTNPKNRVWEVYDTSGTFVGVLHASDIRPLVTATVHWVFVDRELRGKKQLLLNWFGTLFHEFEFQRLTVMVPEFASTYLGYCRSKLGFQYEGQEALKGREDLRLLGMENPHVWVASRGSRRESSHWHEGQWHDVLVLRLLRSDYEAAHAPQ